MLERLVDHGNQFDVTNRLERVNAASAVLVAGEAESWLFANPFPDSQVGGPGDNDRAYLLHARALSDGGLATDSVLIGRNVLSSEGQLHPVGIAATDAGVLLWTDGNCPCPPSQGCLPCTRLVRVARDGGIDRLFLDGDPVGADPDVLWGIDPADTQGSDQQLDAIGANDDGIFKTSLMMPIDSSNAIAKPDGARGAFVPILRSHATSQPGPVLSIVPGFDGNEIGLCTYPVGPGFEPVVSATRRHVFARSTDRKQVKIFDR